MQASNSQISHSMIDVCRATMYNEGVRGLFKGMLSPLIGVTPYNTLVFTVTESTRTKLNNSELSETTKSLFSGSFAAAVSLVIYNPVELLKCRAQIKRDGFVKYSEAIPELIANEGYLGLYKGFVPCFCRDVPAWGVYF
mmetsp:Transcript_30996/g.22529  ORF Transcript_30996/g.22529 Transcript_30996/m.22529 type:complete len:139 (-) Transcript_30996:445-861(-)